MSTDPGLTNLAHAAQEGKLLLALARRLRGHRPYTACTIVQLADAAGLPEHLCRSTISRLVIEGRIEASPLPCADGQEPFFQFKIKE